MATPMNGAVQGVATSTASSPVKKLPACPAFPASRPPAPTIPAPISNAPDRFSPTANNTHAMPTTNTGDWNWNPQPAAAPAARVANNAPASAANVTSTPAV